MSQLDTLIRPTHAIGSSSDALPLDRDLFSAPHLSLSSDDIIPRSLLLEAALNRGHGWPDEPMTVALNRQEYLVKQHHNVQHAAYRHFMAERRVAARQEREVSAVRKAILSQAPDTILHRRAEDTLAAARAARETLLAKRILARERMNEAKLQMQVFHDEEEDLNVRIRVALRQVGAIIRDMNIRGIYSTSLVDPNEDDGYEELPVPFSMQCVAHGQATPTPGSATVSVSTSMR